MDVPPIENEAELIGVVLAGGRSKRMGQAKAHMEYGAEPQWLACERSLKAVCDQVFFSVSPQLDPPLPVDRARSIYDIFIDPIGPLGGILSSFKSLPQKAIFFLACDMPYFSAMAARALVSRRNPHKKATLFIRDALIEPLCGIYEPDIFFSLLPFWARGTYCPRQILRNLDVEKTVAEDERWLININHTHQGIAPSRTKKSVRVSYYAQLREGARRSEEVVTTSSGVLRELFIELSIKYSWKFDEGSLRYARNDQIVNGDTPIADNDSIVFIPPVSGG